MKLAYRYDELKLRVRLRFQTSANVSRFTGKERDAESGNDYFGARYYASSMGRFMSPDWAAKLEGSNPVPYANLEYPQTLNLYSYAGNNPLSRTDPDGHCTNGGKQQGFWWLCLAKIQSGRKLRPILTVKSTKCGRSGAVFGRERGVC
jgi:RHS repeat-associated protein